jgi:excinuclease UvrABC ATPase subunit
VGTVTEIYDYLRLLWARVGTPHCPKCGKEIRQQTIDQIIDQVLALPEGTRIQVMAPVVRGKKGEYTKVFEDARRSGYVRVRVDGSLYELDEEIEAGEKQKAQHRNHGGPAHHAARHPPAAHRLGGDGVGPGGRHRAHQPACGRSRI